MRPYDADDMSANVCLDLSVEILRTVFGNTKLDHAKFGMQPSFLIAISELNILNLVVP